MAKLWEPIVQELLGGRSDTWHCQFNGLLWTEPGAAEQAWHADGEHLFFEQGVRARAFAGVSEVIQMVSVALEVLYPVSVVFQVLLQRQWSLK